MVKLYTFVELDDIGRVKRIANYGNVAILIKTEKTEWCNNLISVFFRDLKKKSQYEEGCFRHGNFLICLNYKINTRVRR